MNKNELKTNVNDFWNNYIIPTLVKYIKIPNKSPSFDKDWKKNGYMDKVLNLAKKWTKEHLQSLLILSLQHR